MAKAGQIHATPSLCGLGVALFCVGWLGCGADGLAPADASDDAALVDTSAPVYVVVAGLHVKMAFAREAGLFSAPVPALDLADTMKTATHPSRAVLMDWPGAAADPYLSALMGPAFAQGGRASQAGALYLPLGGLEPASRAALIDMPRRVIATPEAAAALGIVVTLETGEDTPRPWPFEWDFVPDGGPFGAPDLLVIKPVVGIPFLPNATVQVAVTRALATNIGATPGRDEGLVALLNSEAAPWRDSFARDPGSMGLAPDDHDQAYRRFFDTMSTNDDEPIPGEALIGAALVPIADAADLFIAPARVALARDAAELGALVVTETYDDFCVAEAEATVPDYQHGDLPFNSPGDGRWILGPDGGPTVVRQARSRVFVTIPRAPPSDNALPVAVFIRTGGGGDRPLIDRGVRGVAHGEPLIPRGDGPAKHLARAGWVGLSWDGPHGGLRNISGGDEQFLMFNMINPVAAIANIQQTAIEAVLLRRAFFNRVSTTQLPSCDDGPSTLVREDSAVLMGHSMGAWIAPLVMALEPDIDGVVMSGAGGAWIENVVYKLSPLPTKPLAELILGYDSIDRELTPFDPALTLLQWAGEAADPQIFGRHAMSPARNVLVIQGVVDTYIMPPIAQALQVALGLDLALPALDRTEPRLAAFPPLGEALALVDRRELSRPVQGNRDGHTAVVVQLPEDGIEDGHEVFFQRADARRLWGCWLFDLAEGRVPTVRGELDTTSDNCPLP